MCAHCTVTLMLPALCGTALQDDRGTVAPQYHGTPPQAHCHTSFAGLHSADN
jgi:hypothetical protein